MIEKFKSRKFLLSLAATLFIALTEVFGVDIPPTTYWAIVAAVIAYVMGESYIDAQKK